MQTFPKPLTPQEERILLEKSRHGDTAARTQLIERNLRLVAHIARKYQSPEDEMDDLISIGTIGLLKATDTFDPQKGSKLATYAARCIDNAILSQIRLMVWKMTPFQKNSPAGGYLPNFQKTVF